MTGKYPVIFSLSSLSSLGRPKIRSESWSSYRFLPGSLWHVLSQLAVGLCRNYPMTCHQGPVGSPESSDLWGVSFVSADSNLQSGPIMSSPVSFSIIFQVRDRLLQLPHPPVRRFTLRPGYYHFLRRPQGRFWKSTCNKSNAWSATKMPLRIPIWEGGIL